MKWQRALYQPNLPLGKNGEYVTACEEHRMLSKEAAKEGMVLLKNEDHILPLAHGTRVALFGKGCIDYVKGGGGSGDVTTAYTVNLFDGLQAMGDRVAVFLELAEFYQKNVKHQYARGIEPGMTTEPELTDEMCRTAKSSAEVAIITICRFSGEGWDRKSTYDRDRGEKEDSIFEDGDFYLTHAEKAMVEKVKHYFQKVVVVMNVGGMVDTGWFQNDDGISAVLMAWQGGMEGGNAVAELLCGIGNPSGKLSDTFAARLEDYPSSGEFHQSDSYVDYSEDIYVGYRYFETIPGKKEKVNYPFGFGLSYTEFDWEVVSFVKRERDICIRIRITNVGERPGKEVIQVYVSAPQGLLCKSKKSLAAFQKTRLLACGESEILTVTVDMYSQASYDDLGKICRSAYVLEAGTYLFYVGTSVRDVRQLEETFDLENTVVTEKLTSRIAPTSLKHRMLADGSFEKLPQSPGNNPDACELEFMPKEPVDGLTPASRSVPGVLLWSWRYKENIRPFTEVAEGKMTVQEFIRQLTDEELAHLLGGQPNTGVANTFGVGNMPEYGIPNFMTADGPAGLRIEPQCGICTTAWPCATLLACTWNPDLVCEVGRAGAREVKENNISIWLTPAVNIHRSPLCGRNFEYYSEDPYLTGKMAIAMVKGIQSVHIGAAVKHFALNNKETNRKNSDSRVSERAAREIYLKAFEMVVKEANPFCIMSSYNIINGCRASENRDLLQGILRDEWGFEGVVTTDWWTLGEHYKEVRAGNDLKMACGFPERLIEAKEKGILSREEMEICGVRILELLLKLD